MADPFTISPGAPGAPAFVGARAATSSQSPDGHNDEVTDWGDLGSRMWDFLTRREAAVHYRFEDLAIEVPRDIGPTAPRATWRLQGTVTITSSDNAGT
jgi:hypothetical protein